MRCIDDEKKAKYRELAAAADAAWKADDMEEWERLRPLVAAALAESGIEVKSGFWWQFPPPGYRPEDNREVTKSAGRGRFERPRRSSPAGGRRPFVSSPFGWVPVTPAEEPRESETQPFLRDLSAAGGRRPAPASAAGW